MRALPRLPREHPLCDSGGRREKEHAEERLVVRVLPRLPREHPLCDSGGRKGFSVAVEERLSNCVPFGSL